MDINITNPVTASKIGEVVNASASATPNDTDLVPIVESSVTKKLTLTNLKAFLKTYFDTLYSALTASSFGTFINGLTSKTTPVDADQLVISDSAAANVAKKVTGTNFKAYLKTYFDTLYQVAGSYLTSANITQTITNGVTTSAPSENAVFNALEKKNNNIITNHGIFSPLDSTTYYVGYGYSQAPLTTNISARFKIWGDKTIIGAIITAKVSSVFSNESVEIYLTNITDSVDSAIITNLDLSNALTNGSFSKIVTGLNIATSTTKEYTTKRVFPALATNGTNLILTVELITN